MMTIGKLAAAAAVGVETIRFYQRRGLLETPTRDSGIRRYGSEDLRRLRFLREAQAAGFSLAEIAELIALDASQDRPRAHAMAKARIKLLDAQIAKLRAARASLARLADECASGDFGPCPIIDSFGRRSG